MEPITSSARRTYVITDDVARTAPAHLVASHVRESSTVANLMVNVGGGRSADTRATVSLFFGRTEITAKAVSKTTGDSRNVVIDWDRGAGMRVNDK